MNVIQKPFSATIFNLLILFAINLHLLQAQETACFRISNIAYHQKDELKISLDRDALKRGLLQGQSTALIGVESGKHRIICSLEDTLPVEFELNLLKSEIHEIIVWREPTGYTDSQGSPRYRLRHQIYDHLKTNEIHFIYFGSEPEFVIESPDFQPIKLQAKKPISIAQKHHQETMMMYHEGKIIGEIQPKDQIGTECMIIYHDASGNCRSIALFQPEIESML